ncbi:MAG: DUF1588 domain-containing protein [Deltaproteobacteria bacterium]|nr:DUF1588 domain-containing protein [Deltaproteobacteria bacterium]
MKFSSRVRSKVEGALLVALGTALSGCSGMVGTSATPSDVDHSVDEPPLVLSERCESNALLKARVMRLPDEDLKTLIRQSLSLDAKDKTAANFTLGGSPREAASQRTLSSAGFAAYRGAMLAAAKTHAAALPATSPCLDSSRVEQCADGPLRKVVMDLFHGELAEEDWQRVRAGHKTLVATYGAKEGFEGSVAAALMAPQTLFQAERGAGGEQEVFRLSNTEALSQAALAFTGSMPDAESLSHFASLPDDTFRTELAGRVAEWSESPSFRARMKGWAESWMGIAHLPELERDGTDFSPALKQAMRDQALSFFEETMLNKDGSFEKLFTAPADRNQTGLQPLYSAADPKERVGFLTLPAVLAAHASPTGSDPVKRGLLIRIALLCEPMPPPVANADFSRVTTTPDMQTRERFDALAQAPQCGGCHQVINPPGYLFEHYDQLGRYRSQEKGRPINARASVPAFFDEAQYEGAEDLDGVAALTRWLAGSPRARACFASRAMEYVLADALPDGVDNCALNDVAKRFEKGGQFSQLLADIATSDLFLYRTRSGAL